MGWRRRRGRRQKCPQARNRNGVGSMSITPDDCGGTREGIYNGFFRTFDRGSDHGIQMGVGHFNK